MNYFVKICGFAICRLAHIRKLLTCISEWVQEFPDLLFADFKQKFACPLMGFRPKMCLTCALSRVRKWGKLCCLPCWSSLWPLHMVSCNNWDSVSAYVLISVSAIDKRYLWFIKGSVPRIDSAIYYSIYTTLVLLNVIDYEKCYLDMMAQSTVLLYIWPLEMVYYSISFLLRLSLLPLEIACIPLAPSYISIHCKKELAIFPSPAGMSQTKLSLGGKN
jgi:hypothetical protein